MFLLAHTNKCNNMLKGLMNVDGDGLQTLGAFIYAFNSTLKIRDEVTCRINF